MSATALATAHAVLEDDAVQRDLDSELAALKARHSTPRDARWTEASVREDVADEPTTALSTLAYLDRLVPEMLAEVAGAAQTIVEALRHNALPGEPEWTVQDVVGWVARAIERGCAFPRLSGREVEKVWTGEAIPNAPLREAFEEQSAADDVDHLASTLAYAAGLVRHDGKADTTRVLRMLGIEPASSTRGNLPTLAIFVPCQAAARFADVLGLDYHALGL